MILEWIRKLHQFNSVLYDFLFVCFFIYLFSRCCYLKELTFSSISVKAPSELSLSMKMKMLQTVTDWFIGPQDNGGRKHMAKLNKNWAELKQDESEAAYAGRQLQGHRNEKRCSAA